MFGWLKRRMEMRFTAAMENDIRRFVAGLRGASAEEIGLLLLIANHWRRILEQEFGWNLDHPELIPAKHPAAAWHVNRMIQKVQKQNPAMASGLMVWLHTLRASDVPEIRLAGRELWGQLHRGMPHVRQASLDTRDLFGVALDPEGCGRYPEYLGYDADAIARFGLGVRHTSKTPNI